MIDLCWAIGTGLLFAASFPPLDFGFLGFIAIWPWCRLAEKGGILRVFLLGYVAGATLLAAGCFWLRLSHPLNWVLMVLIEALFYGAFALLLRWLLRTGTIPVWLAMPVAWTSLELARSRGPFAGFPWLLLGYTQHRFVPLLQISDVTGVLGLSFLLSMVGGWLASVGRNSRRQVEEPGDRILLGSIVVVSVLAAALVYGMLRCRQILPSQEGPRLLILQANIPQQLKNQGQEDSPQSAEEILRKHLEIARSGLQRSSAPIDYIVWPETMFPYALMETGDDAEAADIRDRILRPLLLDRGSCGLVVGVVTIRGSGDEGGRFNSAVVFEADGIRSGTYHKAVLVPGGEYIPFLRSLPRALRDLVDRCARGITGGILPDLSKGLGPRCLILKAQGKEVRTGVSICFEIAHPDYQRRLVRDGAEFLINLSNEGWFPDSAEFAQYTAIAALRACELKRPLVRAANTGTSGWIDPFGRVHALELGGRRNGFSGSLEVAVPLVSPTTLYSRLGDWLGWTSLAILGLFAAQSFRKKKIVTLTRRTDL